MVDLHDRLKWPQAKQKSESKPITIWERIMPLRKVLILLALEAIAIGWLAYQAGRHEAPQEPKYPEPSETAKELAREYLQERFDGVRN